MSTVSDLAVDDGNSNPDPEKKYTEEELKEKIEHSMKRWRKQLQKDLDDRTKENETLKKEMEQLKVVVTKPPEGPGTGPADTVEGKIELLTRRHEEQMAALQSKVEAADTARKAAENKAKETRRDTMLTAALSAAGCRDVKAGYRYLIPEIEWDDLEEEWRVKTPSGNLVEIVGDTVRELLPDYLLTPQMAGSGSGSTSGGAGIKAKHFELAEAKKKLKEIFEQSRGKDRDVHEYSKQKSIVQKLEAEIAASSKR